MMKKICLLFYKTSELVYMGNFNSNMLKMDSKHSNSNEMVIGSLDLKK